jgi:hypothetical protein
LSGYVASLLVFAAFYMKSMVPLRLVAIASNLAFIVYALHGGLMPVLLLHGALLPLNILRLMERRRFRADTEAAASEELSLHLLMPQWAAAALSHLPHRTISNIGKSRESAR